MSLRSAISFPGLAKHWRVLRGAWRDENAAARSRKPLREHEFLPAALEIIEKPPSPGLRVLTLSLCAFFAIALVWSFVGRVDVVAVASGRTMPTSRVNLIQPLESGVIRRIHVRNGERVRRGQLLIELDSTMTGADESQARRALMTAQTNAATNQALLAHIDGRTVAFSPPAGTAANVADTQRQLIRTRIAEYEASRSRLIQNRAERAAELSSAAAEITKLRDTLPILDQQLAARRQLTERGHFSRLQLLDYERARVEHIQNIVVQESAAARARAGINAIDAELRTLRETFARSAVTEVATAEVDSGLRTEDLARSAQRRTFQQLRAPIDGIVQQLAVHTEGGVVQPAQTLMLIVPSGTGIDVEANILNRDIGFIREGQTVRVKLEAFPFTDYGLIEGVVEIISRDAIESEELGLVYAARIRLDRDFLMIAGRRQPIGPGMAVQAEIKTGERRIIKYLLSPISTTVAEAGRER